MDLNRKDEEFKKQTTTTKRNPKQHYIQKIQYELDKKSQKYQYNTAYPWMCKIERLTVAFTPTFGEVITVCSW